MKSYTRIGMVLAILASLSLPAQAEIFRTANLLRPGHFTLGIAPSATFNPSQFMLFLHGGVGLSRFTDLELKLGLGNQVYFAGNMQFQLVPETRDVPAVSVMGGLHGTSNVGIETGLNISKYFGTFSLYSALNPSFEFLPDRMAVPFYFNLGVAIPINHMAHFYLEGNIGLNADSASGMSGGLRFFF